jgi:hypothetical protein
MMVSPAMLVACARRELRLRMRKYPEWIAAGRLPMAEAEKEIACMTKIVEVLESVKTIDDLCRADVALPPLTR